MKRILSFSLIFCFLGFTPSASAWVPYKAIGEKVEIQERKLKKIEKAERKKAQRKAKLEQRLEKFKAKLKKKSINAEQQVSSIWDDSRFKLGALLILGAIGLGIISALGILSGLFNFLAGLLALAGIILVIWALVTY